MERKERLDKILNKSKRGNPNHDKEGKFTFAPYKKYPGLEQSAKKLAKLQKAEKGLTEKYLKSVDAEREKLFNKYKLDKNEIDLELSKWNDGWFMWDEKHKAGFSDIDIALSKAILKETGARPTVYRTQVDSKTPGKMSPSKATSWSPNLRYVAHWAKWISGYTSKIDVFKTVANLENVQIIPDVLYANDRLRDKVKYKEFILSNKSTLKAIDENLSYDDLIDKYLNSIHIENGGPGSGNFNPGQGRGIGKPAKGVHSDHYKSYDEAEHKKYIDAKHKLPKERRTEKQQEIIHSLENMGVLSPEMSKWLRLYGDEDSLFAVEKALSDAEAVGLDLSRVHLEKLRTGSKVWGRAWYSGKLAFVSQFLDGNPGKLYHITFNSNGYHTNDTLEGLARHEVGHLISYQNASSKDLDPANYCGKVVNKCYRKVISEEGLPDVKKLPDSVISRHGKINFNETIAESWSNPDYSAFTKEIYNTLLEDSMNKKKNNSLELNARDIPLCVGYGPEFEEENDRIKRLENLLSLNVGNPYHDEEGKFTFSPEGVGAKFYEPKDYYTRPDVKTTHGIYDINHNGYLVVKDRNAYIRENLSDNDVKLNDKTTKENLENLSEQELKTLADYTKEYGGINYSQINKYLRTGEGSDEVKKAASDIISALEKVKVGGEGLVFRGVDASVIGGKKLETELKKLKNGLKRGTIKDASKILENVSSLEGKTFTDKAPLSTNSHYKSSYGQRDVLLAINVGKDTKGLDISSLSSYGNGEKDAWTKAFGSGINAENEVLLAPNTTLKFKKVTLDNGGVTIECDVESKRSNSRIERLNALILNGGPGSGNFNPGQGQGIGKPAKGSNKSSTTFSVDGYSKEKLKEVLEKYGVATDMNIGIAISNAAWENGNKEDYEKVEKILEERYGEDWYDSEEAEKDKDYLEYLERRAKRIEELQKRIYSELGIEFDSNSFWVSKDIYNGIQKAIKEGNLKEFINGDTPAAKEDPNFVRDPETAIGFYRQKSFNFDSGNFNVEVMNSSSESGYSDISEDNFINKSDYDKFMKREMVKVNNDEVRSWYTALDKAGTYPPISRAEERSLQEYNLASAVNQQLREGKTSKTAENIASAIDKKYSHSDEVYRGVRGDFANKLSSLKKGDTITDKGFMSTSSIIGGDDSGAAKFGKTIMKIKTKSGFGQSIDMSPYVRDMRYLDEGEILLQKDTTIKYTGNSTKTTDKDGNDIIIYEFEVE